MKNFRPASQKMQTLDRLLPILKKEKQAGKTVAFTNGCFDLIHAGHVRYLTKARSFGDLLVIAVNADATVTRLKGPERPINTAAERMETLAGFGFCDYVFEFFEDDPHKVISAIVPDVLVKGADWPIDQIVGRDVVEAAGGKVERVEVVQGASTTNLIEKIKDK